MENQRPAKRREQAAAGSDDRISQLPEHILHHHILSLLSQRDAVRTCILSKSWRHLGPTRPKIEFRQTLFGEGKNKFLSILENTLQRYVDQKLPIQEFILEMSTFRWATPEFESTSLLLNKWIPIVVMNMGVKKFTLEVEDYPVPSVVFRAEFLEELSLFSGCKININNCINAKLQMLKRLVLIGSLHIVDEAFEKIMSSCPLVEYVDVSYCHELSTIKLNMARNLKHFVCDHCNSLDSIEFNDDTPSLKTIRIGRCEVWFDNYFFPSLKSLYLDQVHLRTEESLNNLNCPCLEELRLCDCSGFTEFKLSNRSIKRLIISVSKSHPIKVISIDAANMIYFDFRFSGFVPSVISFTTTTTSECKSRIHVQRSSDVSKAGDFSSTWSLELYKFLKALSSQSQISLYISYFPPNQGTFDSSCEPVRVEHLCLRAHLSSSSAFPYLYNSLFRICRPRYRGLTFSAKI